MDNTSYMSMDAAALQAYNLNQNPPPSTDTNFCHIFPPSTNWGFDPNDPLQKKVSSFSFIIYFFCHLTYYRKNMQEMSGLLSIPSGLSISSSSLMDQIFINLKMDLLWTSVCILRLITSGYGLNTLQ